MVRPHQIHFYALNISIYDLFQWLFRQLIALYVEHLASIAGKTRQGVSKILSLKKSTGYYQY